MNSDIDILREEAARHFEGVPDEQRQVPTPIPYLSFLRFLRPTEMNRGILEPSMCLVLQGRKKVLIGAAIKHYGPGSYVLSVVDMPVSGQVTRATQDEPYLALKIDLDPKEIAALVIDLQLAVPDKPASAAGACVDAAGAELQDAFVRLLTLLAAPADRAALAPLVKQEILYRLLSGPSGAMLYHTLLGERREQGVSAAILWIKQHYDQPMKIEELARAVSMSPSVLHRRFKAVTVMSPLQYQKRMRLTEARKLLLAGSMEAATAAYRVGYESPSQFSREYRRLFGASPLQDAEFLRHRDIE